MKPFQKNDRVYFRTSYVSHNEGIVLASLQIGNELYLKIKGIGDTIGTQAVLAAHCFHSAEELASYNQMRSTEQYQNYRASIETVNDLVAFMFQHTVSKAEEYTDWEAPAAVCDAARDLLGLKLNIE